MPPFDWTNLLGPGVLVGLLSLVGIIYTARSGREAALPEHLDRELKRMAQERDTAEKEHRRERDEDRQRISRIESHLVDLGDHIDLLEQWIWERREPPPPQRPRFRPARKETTDV